MVGARLPLGQAGAVITTSDGTPGVPAAPEDEPATSTHDDAPAAQPREEARRATSPALDVVLDLQAQLEDVAFPLDLPGAERARELRHRVSVQLATHLVPRLREASLPAVVVVGGPTGAGKSTLVNAIAGESVSPAGVVRPTTRRPVLVVHPDDAEPMAEHPVAARAALVHGDVPRGLALLDAPDLDSVDEANRALAVELVEVADVWLFVTTANRYGDALPWAVLDQVRRRGITLGVVLDRVPRESLDIVRRDLLGRLQDAGFGSLPLFVVPDAGPLAGPLAPAHVSEVDRWLRLLASRAASREVVARTLRGVWDPLRAEVRELVDAATAQVEEADALLGAASAVLPPAVAALSQAIAAGVLTEGAPTTRWVAGAGSRGPLEPLAHEVTGFFGRRRVERGREARGAALAALVEELRSAFVDVVGDAARRTDAEVVHAWTGHSAAGAALAEARHPDDVVGERRERLSSAWTGWVSGLGTLGLASATGGQDARPPLLDPDGERALVALAAAALPAAEQAARRLGAGGADDAVAAARAALQEAAAGVLADEVRASGDTVSAQLSIEAATALRVRVGELRTLAGEEQ